MDYKSTSATQILNILRLSTKDGTHYYIQYSTNSTNSSISSISII